MEDSGKKQFDQSIGCGVLSDQERDDFVADLRAELGATVSIKFMNVWDGRSTVAVIAKPGHPFNLRQVQAIWERQEIKWPYSRRLAVSRLNARMASRKSEK